MAGGVISIEYDWKKDGVTLGAPSQATYSIASATQDHAGTYRCTVSDEMTSLESNEAVLTVFERPLGGSHTADQDGDFLIALTELLRVIQFFNSSGFHCADDPGSTEDGYVPGPGANESCDQHASDYAPHNWRIELTELLRVIQFYNSGGYRPYCGTEDDFAPGPGVSQPCEAEGAKR